MITTERRFYLDQIELGPRAFTALIDENYSGRGEEYIVFLATLAALTPDARDIFCKTWYEL